MLGAVLARAGERAADWLIPTRLNYRLAALAARLAVRVARSPREKDEAADALANVLASIEDEREISPLAAVMPVLVRCMVSRSRRSPANLQPIAYSNKVTNSKGVTYYANSKMVTLRGGKVQTIYYFSKDERPETGCCLPADRVVNENPRNGFLTLKRK